MTDQSDSVKESRASRKVPIVTSRATADWPKWLDRSLTGRFPDIGWTTFWDVTADIMGAYVTQRGDRKPVTKEQRRYIEGWMAGRDAMIDIVLEQS